MLATPWDVLTKFPVRKTKEQKKAFRDAVQSYAEGYGYPCTVERRNASCRNLVIGDPEKAKYLVTAHYDTCARMPFPNWLTPCNFWPFFLWQAALVLMFLGAYFLISLAASSVLGSGLGAVIGYLTVLLLLGLMLFGPANPNNANDNTSGVITLLEILRTMPENQRSKVCFVLFDQEEAGLIGSSYYRKLHRKATDRQLVLNLDCVGDGDHIRFFPTKALKRNRKKLTSLYKACGYLGKKDILVHEKGFGIYPSDQSNFPYGVGICALQKGRFGLYVSKIHTKKDTILDRNNVNLLRAALTTFICRDAVN